MKDEISSILQGNKFYTRTPETSELLSLKKSLDSIIEDAIRTGETPYDWKVLRSLIIYRIREALVAMQMEYPDCKNTPTENFETLFDGVTQLFLNFEDR